MKRTHIFLATALIAITAASAASAATVEVRYGDWIADTAAFAMPVVVAVTSTAFLWLIRTLPAPLAGFMIQMHLDSALEKAVTYGFNVTAGAQRGKTLSVDVGSNVVAAAASYALDKFPNLVKNNLGGLGALRDAIVARMRELPAENGGQVLPNAGS